jgi:hypothetical protein
MNVSTALIVTPRLRSSVRMVLCIPTVRNALHARGHLSPPYSLISPLHLKMPQNFGER